MQTISIVVPCYNEQESLPLFYNEITRITQSMKHYNFEFLFVDDGSSCLLYTSEHGDFQMPVWSRVMIGNAPIAEYCHMMEVPWNNQIQQQIFEIVLRMGAEIISRKERTHFGIATCVCYLAESIIYNPVSYTHLDVYKRQVYNRNKSRLWKNKSINT